MKYDARKDSLEGLPPYDLCIVGAGPSGIAIAAELAASGMRVVLLESGSTGASRANELRKVESHGALKVRDSSRERRVGGATAVWGGLSALLDPADFLPRAGLEYAGWPIPYESLDPWLRKAAFRFRFPEPAEFEKSRRTSEDLETKAFIAVVPPVRFGDEYHYLFNQERIDLITDATAVALTSESTADGERVVHAIAFITPEGKRREIRAKTFVLAAGAIENARLLLMSGLGNAHDQVGRYFMDHPKAYVGKLLLKHPVPRVAYREFFGFEEKGKFRYEGIHFTQSAQEKAGHLNAYLRLEPWFPWMEASSVRAWRAVISEGRNAARQFSWASWAKAIATLFKAFPLLPSAVGHAIMRLAAGRDPRTRKIRIRAYLEMAPDAENRVELGSGRDALGIPISRVTARLGGRDFATLNALEDAFVEKSARFISDVERVQFFDRPSFEEASHHLGTTRMGSRPEMSVVDMDLRVWGTGNLYCVGGSVFPTAGCANPTFTMVALALRLADHLTGGRKAAPKSSALSPRARVRIIGAGRRVRDDVIPAFEALADSCEIVKCYARGSQVLFGARGQYAVDALASISERDIRETNILYVAVPQRELSAVFQQLFSYDCKHISLVVDTPALGIPAESETKFKQVSVAEDSVFLPWLPLIARKAARDGPLRSVSCNRSVFRYHGIALLKACFGDGSKPARVIRARRFFNRVRLSFSGDRAASLRGPREYERGSFLFTGADWRVRSGPIMAEGVLYPMTDGLLCTGFALGDDRVALTQVESILIGTWHSGEDTISTRMLDLKRVGLYRLLGNLLHRENAWPLGEGVDDAAIDIRLMRHRIISFAVPKTLTP